jgi:WD repeat-containing protein 68
MFLFHLKVQIVALDEETSEFTARSTFDHPYPTTKIMWIPDTVLN